MEKSNDSIFSMIKLGLTLVCYAVISCTVLALVNNFTSPKIAQNQVEKVNSAMKDFFPEDGLTFETEKDFTQKISGSVKIQDVIFAKNSEGKIVGGACQVNGPTYDQATLIVGLDTDGIIKGVKFLKNTDSPGFGLKANDPTFKLSNGKTFYGQFEGQNAKDGFVLGKTFDGISGATITSIGVANLISVATNELLSKFGGKNE